MKIGDTNPDVTEHVNGVIANMRRQNRYDGEVHTVFVAVYVDGRLEFAGADTMLKGTIDRDVAKWQARDILLRMNPNGDLSKKKGGV